MCYINYIPEQNGTHLPRNYRTNNFFHLVEWGLVLIIYLIQYLVCVKIPLT